MCAVSVIYVFLLWCLLVLCMYSFMYLLVGKIAIMANADYVVDLKTDFK